MSEQTKNSENFLKRPRITQKKVLSTMGLLNQKNCDKAIKKMPAITVDSVKNGFILNGFKAEDFAVSILVKKISYQKTKKKTTHSGRWNYFKIR